MPILHRPPHASQNTQMNPNPGPVTPTTLAPAPTASISDAFFHTAGQQPHRVALVDETGTWSYETVCRRAQHLSHRIRHHTGTSAQPVAIVGHRNGWFVTAILACSQAKVPFALIDGNYPLARVNGQIDALQPALILHIQKTTGPTPTLLPTRAHVLPVGAHADAPAPHTQTPTPHPDPDPGSSAYHLFTSGSTGTPKCIGTPNLPLVHFVAWYQSEFKPSADDRFSLLSGLGHDPVLRDIFVPLSTGASLHIPPQEVLTHPNPLFDWVAQQRITFLHGTPPLFKLLTAGAQAQSGACHLRWIFSGGDVLTASIVRKIHQFMPQTHVVNFYGTTETPQAVAWHRVHPADDDPIPIGQGIDAVKVLVVDETLHPVPPGQMGQVAVSTAYLSNGYLGDSQLTAQKYVAAPHAGATGQERYYLTGDLGCCREDGAVVIRGRMDDQVKIRGYRVEPAEVAVAIESLDGVRACVVLPLKKSGGENLLAAFVVPHTPHHTEKPLRAALSQKMPDHTVPALWILTDAIPVLPNGKTDRARLKAMAELHTAPSTPGTPNANLSEVQIQLLQDLHRILGGKTPDLAQSFDDQGGDSLSHVEGALVIEQYLGYLPDDWETQPLGELIHNDVQTESATYAISTSTLVRALSIVVIVLSHYSHFQLFGNLSGTLALFAMSGLSFAKYSLPRILASGKIQHTVTAMVAIAVPTALYTWANQAYKGDVQWPTVFLMGNLFGMDYAYLYGYWYIAVLVQITLLLSWFFSINEVGKAMARAPFGVGYTLFVSTGLALWLADTLWPAQTADYRFLLESLLMIVFGLCLGLSGRLRHKAVLLASLAALAALGWLGVYPAMALLSVLLVERLSLWRWLVVGISHIAAASLYIYLTHRGFHTLLLQRWGIHDTLVLSIPLAVVFGVVAWKVWTHLWSQLNQAVRGIMPPEKMAA